MQRHVVQRAGPTTRHQRLANFLTTRSAVLWATRASYDIMIKLTASRQSIGGEEVTIMQTLLDLLVAVMTGVITDLIGKWLDGIKKR